MSFYASSVTNTFLFTAQNMYNTLILMLTTLFAINSNCMENLDNLTI